MGEEEALLVVGRWPLVVGPWSLAVSRWPPPVVQIRRHLSSAGILPAVSRASRPRTERSPTELTVRHDGGMVMNGPTPIMSIMFSAVALLTPIPRIRDVEASLVAGRWSLAKAMSFTGEIALVVDEKRR